MSFTQLKAFHYVALSNSFSRASRQMAISQSTLSTHVRQLETRYGLNLFERKMNGVVLSAVGKDLFEITTKLFDAEQQAQEFLKGERLVYTGRIRVAADGPILVLPILTHLKNCHSNLTFSLSIDNSVHVVEQLINQRVDIAISAFLSKNQELAAEHFLSMRLGLCVSCHHPLAKRISVSMQEIKNLPFVLREIGSRTREVFEANINHHGLSLKNIVATSSREGVAEAVALGVGASIVGDREFGNDDRLCFIPINDADITIDEYIIYFKEHKNFSLIKKFIETAKLLYQ